MRPTTSRRISSTNILRQYHQQSTFYDALPSSLATGKTISLPFTYFHHSPIRQSRTNFEQISAWLNHTAAVTKTNHILCINQHKQPSISSSSAVQTDHQEITVVMKQTSMNIKPPKRSSSLVTKLTRPISEQQSQRSNSPTLSFSSSVLTKGMSERLTPPSQKPVELETKSNRRRAIDFSRRRTVTGTSEKNANKENLTLKQQPKVTQDIYQFTPSSSKHTSTTKYYFNSPTNEDLLNNSYGLTLLQQPQAQPLKQRHSLAAVLTISQPPKNLSSSQVSSIPSPPTYTFDSLDDLLCDREVESYFYPITSSLQSEHIYMNLPAPPPNQYYLSTASTLAYTHGTLC